MSTDWRIDQAAKALGQDHRIVALDLSLTSTGVAVYPPKMFDHDTYCLRSKLSGPARLAGLRDMILTLADQAHLVAIEGYSFASRNHRAEAIGELGGVIRVALWEAGIPYVEISPAELKKYATGKGNTMKPLVYQAAIVRGRREFGTTDEADAWWLLQMALAHYGLPHVPMPAINRAVLDKIAWPTLTTEVPA